MKKKVLRSEQIITLNDYPVRNMQILKIYFRIFQKGQGKIVPPCPVIHKSIGIPLIKGEGIKIKKYNALLMRFLEQNPQAEYFLLDGTHKTTAATLSRNKIPVMVFRRDKDIRDAKKLVKSGEIISLTTGDTIKEVLEILKKHFLKTMIFQTVADKTRKMVKNRDVPEYMVITYSKKRLK